MAAVAENGTPAVADENSAPVTETQTGDAVTVFHNPDDFNVKHPLMHEWTLWFTKPPSGKVGDTSGIDRRQHAYQWNLGRQLERPAQGGGHFQLR